MLSFVPADRQLSRRAMLTVGGLGLGGLSLSHLLAAKALGSGGGTKPITTGKSVILLLQHGGPTQFETFDPKLDVPDGIRTVGGVTATSVPGMQFGATLAGIARHADKLAVVRSYASGSGGHSLQPLVSGATQRANMGSLFARLAGANDPRTGMPNNVTVFPNSVDDKDLGSDDRFGSFAQVGELGKAYSPFAPGGGGQMQQNMTLSLAEDRFDDRRNLLSSLDRLRREVDSSGSMDGVDKFRQQAFEMVTRGVADAFDLTKEDPRTLARYDTAAYVHPGRYKDKTNGQQQRGWYDSNARSLGKLLLLARRLCEAGCGFVTVATRFVWDMHGDANNVGVTRGMEAVGEPYDHAVSAFIEDCEARGLGDDILLVSTGEMGRTPKINARGGRDHWGRLTPLMMYGGGVTHGQTIGQSTRDGAEPAIDAVDESHLLATVMHNLFDIGELRIRQGLPTDLVRYVTSQTPIPGLF